MFIFIKIDKKHRFLHIFTQEQGEQIKKVYCTFTKRGTVCRKINNIPFAEKLQNDNSI